MSREDDVLMEGSAQIVGIPHITIGASDLKKSVSCQDIVGLEKVGEWPDHALFDVAGVTLSVNRLIGFMTI